MSTSGHLKWMFRGWYRDVSFWGLVIIVVGATVKTVWPEFASARWIVFAGFVVIFLDILRAYFKFSRSMYEMEQNELWQQLKSGDKRGNS